MSKDYTFAGFTIDLDRCVLLRVGIEVPLRPKTFDLLHYLVQHPGKLITREKLIKAVWPDVVVTDNSLSQCLAELRKALGDDRHEMVRTVPRRGYLFDEHVVRATSEAVAPQRPDTEDGNRRNPPKAWALVVVVLLAAILGVTWWQTNSGPRGANQPAEALHNEPENSIAVLPFADLSPGGDHEYLADGIAEEILNLLSQTDGLMVIARTAAFSFKGQNPELSEVARRLNTSYILEGSVRVAGKRVRITAQLIDVTTGMHLWSNAYDEELNVETLFDIQSQVAQAITDALSSRIVGVDHNLPALAGPANLEAFNEYLEGQLFLRRIETNWQRDEGVFESAIAHFRASIEADPAWAPAHVALGRVYHFWISLGHPERLGLAKAHVLEGLRLDDSYAPGYASLGFILYRERDFEESLSAYQRMRELGSDMSWGYAILLRSLGRFDESVTEYRNALLRDPLSEILRVQLGNTLLCDEKYEEAAELFEALMEAIPDSLSVHVGWIEAKLGLGERAAALARIEQLQDSALTASVDPADLAPLLALAGRKQQAGGLLDQLEENRSGHPVLTAWTAVLLGDTDRALAILERTASEQPDWLLHMRCPPEIRELTGNPRYERILDRVGFPR